MTEQEARAERRRVVATRGDQVIRGVGVTSDENGPYRLRFRIDGVPQAVTLSTREWRVFWEDVWERSRVVVAAPSDTDAEPLTNEALWDFADDLLELWNIEDLNPPSLTEQFRDRFVARFGAAQPVQVEVTAKMRERAVDAVYDLGEVGTNYIPEYQANLIYEVVDAVLSAALGGGEAEPPTPRPTGYPPRPLTKRKFG